jgi:hypothetical protein
MRWTPWFIANHYAYRQAGNGAFVELRCADEPLDNHRTVFLQADEAGEFLDQVEVAESLADGPRHLPDMLDNLIDPYFTT